MQCLPALEGLNVSQFHNFYVLVNPTNESCPAKGIRFNVGSWFAHIFRTLTLSHTKLLRRVVAIQIQRTILLHTPILSNFAFLLGVGKQQLCPLLGCHKSLGRSMQYSAPKFGRLLWLVLVVWTSRRSFVWARAQNGKRLQPFSLPRVLRHREK